MTCFLTLLTTMTLNDFEPKTRVLVIFCNVCCKRVNCDETGGDRPNDFEFSIGLSLPANRNCCRLLHVSWALAQISGSVSQSCSYWFLLILSETLVLYKSFTYLLTLLTICLCHPISLSVVVWQAKRKYYERSQQSDTWDMTLKDALPVKSMYTPRKWENVRWYHRLTIHFCIVVVSSIYCLHLFLFVKGDA